MLRFVCIAVNRFLCPVDKRSVIVHCDRHRIGNEVGFEALATRLGILTRTHVVQLLVHAEQHLIYFTVFATVIDECHLGVFNGNRFGHGYFYRDDGRYTISFLCIEFHLTGYRHFYGNGLIAPVNRTIGSDGLL